jgi:predicted RNase H-like HicB family nuclease
MAPTLLESESNSMSFVFDAVEWPKQAAYRCHVCVIPEEDGGFSAIVLNLPGAGSSGETEPEALANVEESIRGLIEVYGEHGDPIPWKDYRSEEIPEGAKAKWILVNV